MTLGAALGLLALTRGWIVPLAMYCSLIVLTFLLHKKASYRIALLALPVALVVISAWLYPCKTIRPFNSSPFDAWMEWNYRQVDWPSWETFKYCVKNSIWFAWPAWPFAGWAVYAWRRQFSALHIAIPVSFFCGLIIVVLLNQNSEPNILLPLLPPLAILAAFGLPTMKRGAINAVDWFSVMTLTASAAVIWIFWIAKETGWPHTLARNVLKLVPGFKPEANWLALTVAILVSAAWITLVHWRISRRPSVLWRAVVLSSGGVILCWMLLTTLWMPWGNYMKSYAGVANQIAANLPPGHQCVDADIGPAQRASFAYFGHIPFAQFDAIRCDLLLLQDNNRKKDPAEFIERLNYRWQLLWEGRRPSDRDERFRLYRRIN